LSEASAGLSAAVLISGGGSNLGAFIDATESGELPLNLCVVLSNKTEAAGLDRARHAGLNVECIRHQDFPERSLFDAALVETLEQYRPDLIILAGFMRILTPTFVDRFAGRILNIHPSYCQNIRGWTRINARLMPAINGMAAPFISSRGNWIVARQLSRAGCQYWRKIALLIWQREC